ncbi:hypothetical protein SAMN05444374_11653 [Rhodococcoides kroppenstedtii]|uniref:Uncharacterized protein n=1 Tax=Rhodococcoides kroppenstedtii TaxID=293050 RepID=A0A1I0UCB5_9NOCA|nr:hypothetical protein [Rhodococcus kroppenstedtii]SFA60886.1 hypothetical protein SAMN05444374_11653 [Rhodococcus kroppenstedtii]
MSHRDDARANARATGPRSTRARPRILRSIQTTALDKLTVGDLEAVVQACRSLDLADDSRVELSSGSPDRPGERATYTITARES